METVPRRLPEEFLLQAPFYAVLNRHVRPSQYEATNADISEEDKPQAIEHAFRMFALVTSDSFPPIHNQAAIPREDLVASKELIHQFTESLRSYKRREPEPVPTDPDMSVEEGISLYKQGMRVLVLRYGSDRRRCVATDELTTMYFEQFMQAASRRFRGRVAIAGYCRDERLSAANTLDVPAHLGIEKLDLLRMWMQFDVNPRLQERIRYTLGGRTPEDIRHDVESLIVEKFTKYLPLRELGMGVVLQLTTHETHLVATSSRTAPVGFAATTYFGIGPRSPVAREEEVNTPYANQTAKQT